ncbi:FNBP1L [Bugula neritina]|uniref:Protein Dr1 n=1 Tax=Bugula neritina TaxID=10212 RepID=A0A7J7KBS7_BUGNE|nr:FNBP1L [Bugula neritina]
MIACESITACCRFLDVRRVMTEKSGTTSTAAADDDELSVPRSSVNKIIRELAPLMRVSNDTRELIVNCCNEFIHLLASEANDVCNHQTKKTIAPEHVLIALENLGFKSYLADVKDCIEEAKEVALKKRRQSTKLESLGIPEEELLRQQQELFAKEMYKVDTPALLKRSGIRKEAPFALEQAKRFNSWKVRKDLVEVDKVQRKVAERRQTALEASKREEEMLSFPAIKRSQSVALSTERRIEPKAGLKTPILPPGPQISKARTSPKSEVGRSLPASLSAHRYKEIKKDLLEAAEQYMQTTPKPDRRVIDRALSVSNKNYREDLSALHTDLPDTKAEAEKWLEQATPEGERHKVLKHAPLTIQSRREERENREASSLLDSFHQRLGKPDQSTRVGTISQITPPSGGLTMSGLITLSPRKSSLCTSPYTQTGAHKLFMHLGGWLPSQPIRFIEQKLTLFLDVNVYLFCVAILSSNKICSKY